MTKRAEQELSVAFARGALSSEAVGELRSLLRFREMVAEALGVLLSSPLGTPYHGSDEELLAELRSMGKQLDRLRATLDRVRAAADLEPCRAAVPDAQEDAENAELEKLRERVRILKTLNEGHVESWGAVHTALGGCSGKSLRDATLDAIASRDEARQTLDVLRRIIDEQVGPQPPGLPWETLLSALERHLARTRATLARVRAAAYLEPCRAAVLEALGEP